MINLEKAFLPTTVNVAGKEEEIRTSFRFALVALRLLKEGRVSEAVQIMIPTIDTPTIDCVKALQGFLYPPSELPRNTGAEKNIRVIDYTLDSDYITAAFYQCYGIRLTSEKCDLHWHEFLALLHGLRGTALNDIMQIRSWSPTDAKNTVYNKEMARRRYAWELPKEKTAEDIALSNAFNKLFE